MFLGEFKQAIDENGVLVLPSPYLSALASGLIVTRGFDHNLMIFAQDEWHKLARKILSQPMSNHQVRNFRRRIFSNAAMLRIDEDSRILIPSSLCIFAELEGEVVLSGMYDFLEIWNYENWRQLNNSVNGENHSSAWQTVGI